MKDIIPMYILQVLIFFMLIFANEYQFIYSSEVDVVDPSITNHYLKRHSDSSLYFLIIIALFNIAINAYIIRYRFLRSIERGPTRQLQNYRVYIEYVLCTFNICVSIVNIYESSAYAVDASNVY